MADYRYRSNVKALCQGLGGGYAFTVNPNFGWTNGSGSGSKDYTISFVNSYRSGQTQTVTIKVNTAWNTSYDANNRLKISGTTTIKEVKMVSNCTGYNYEYKLYLRTSNQSGPQIGSTLTYHLNDNSTYGNRGAQSFNWTINPGADSDYNTLYVCNVSTYGGHTEANCDVYVDKGTVGIQFHNDRAWIYDAPSVNSVSCGPDGGGAKLTYSSTYGNTLPSSGTNSTKVEISRNNSFTDIVYTTSSTDTAHTFNIGSGTLASNTKYYVRYTATNKAGKTASKTCEFYTLCRNSLSNAVSLRYDRETIDLSVLYGGKAYKPNTDIYIRKCNTTNWSKIESSSTTTVDTLLLTGLEAETCYEVQARTATTAGTYTGNTVRFTTAERDKVTGVITSTDPYIDDNYVTHSKVCFTVTGNCTPITARLQYRIKNGYSDIWMETEPKVYEKTENEDCVVLDELIPNQTTYEVRVYAECGTSTGEGPLTDFITPLLKNPENHNCENYNYMVDMLCQILEAIKNGQKTIYANEDAKKLCDPYSENPTLAAMWSRVLRFFHAATCSMCDMTDVLLKSGLPGQVFMGEVGWTDLAEAIEKGNKAIASSTLAREAIDKNIHEVWHFHGSYSYLVATKTDLNNLTGAANGDKAIVADEGDDNSIAIYKYNGTTWAKSTSEDIDDFSVVQLSKASNTALGIVKPHTEWYFFKQTWQRLDVDTSDIERRLDAIDNQPVVSMQSNTEDKIVIRHNGVNFDYGTLPSNQRTICFVTEDM